MRVYEHVNNDEIVASRAIKSQTIIVVMLSLEIYRHRDPQLSSLVNRLNKISRVLLLPNCMAIACINQFFIYINHISLHPQC